MPPLEASTFFYGILCIELFVKVNFKEEKKIFKFISHVYHLPIALFSKDWRLLGHRVVGHRANFGS